jgi:hypothetical protein
MAEFSGLGQSASKLSFKLVISIVIAVVLLIVGTVWWNVTQIAAIDTFEECAQKYPVMDSFPEQCRTPDGRLYVKGQQP